MFLGIGFPGAGEALDVAHRQYDGASRQRKVALAHDRIPTATVEPAPEEP
jgi:hypothetical protein